MFWRVEIERRRANPDEVGRRIRERPIGGEDRKLNLLAGPGVSREQHAVRRVPAADHVAAGLAEDLGELSVNPDFGVVVDGDFEVDRRTGRIEPAEPSAEL